MKNNIPKHTHIISDIKYKGDLPNIEKNMDDAINEINELHVIKKFKYLFNPYGISLFYVLAESHISIHTWEEYKSINIDCFTCGKTNPEKTLNAFLKKINILDENRQIIKRGI